MYIYESVFRYKKKEKNVSIRYSPFDLTFNQIIDKREIGMSTFKSQTLTAWRVTEHHKLYFNRHYLLLYCYFIHAILVANISLKEA